MAELMNRTGYGLGILVLMLLVSCSASNVDPVDNGGDSRNSDVVAIDDAFDAKDGRDAVGSNDLDADLNDVTIDADGVARDGCGYADCTAMDIPTDAIARIVESKWITRCVICNEGGSFTMKSMLAVAGQFAGGSSSTVSGLSLRSVSWDSGWQASTSGSSSPITGVAWSVG